MEQLTVALGARSYPIHIGRGLLDQAGAYLAPVLGQCAVAIVTDDNVAPLYLRRVEASLEAAGFRAASIVLPHGEQTKCMDSLSRLYAFFAENHITRRDAVLALGGGVMGDLAGLAAATWLRGVRFVQIPTTLLAQVDSSVGGKVAVDLPQGKNLMGAFWQPSAVLVDPDTLHTLTDHYWRDGLGEVVKYGCILDGELFALLEETAPGGRAGVMKHIDRILLRCISAKAQVVQEDERDTGMRMLLNFGHTMGHAAETVQHYAGLSHGEAVAVGMAEISRIAVKKGLTEPAALARLTALEEALGLPTALPDLPVDDLLAAMGQDKKNLGKQLTVILMRRVGESFLHETDIGFFGEN